MIIIIIIRIIITVIIIDKGEGSMRHVPWHVLRTVMDASELAVFPLLYNRWTAGVQQVDSRCTTGGQQGYNRWTAGAQQVDSRCTTGGQQVDSRWTAGAQQVDSRCTTL
jgi:hypothetical protein